MRNYVFASIALFCFLIGACDDHKQRAQNTQDQQHQRVEHHSPYQYHNQQTFVDTKDGVRYYYDPSTDVWWYLYWSNVVTSNGNTYNTYSSPTNNSSNSPTTGNWQKGVAPSQEIKDSSREQEIVIAETKDGTPANQEEVNNSIDSEGNTGAYQDEQNVPTEHDSVSSDGGEGAYTPEESAPAESSGGDSSGSD